MGGGRQERVLTGIDENGKELYQPIVSFYAEDYWGEVAIGSVLLPEEPKVTQEVIELTPDELEVYYLVLNNNDVVLKEGSDE